MAHYKRGKCRYLCPNAIRGSEASWRAKYGLKPVRITKEHWKLKGEAWNALWHPRGRHGNRGRKISGPYSMMSSQPAWFDRIFHTRPRRAHEKRIERAILIGRIDPDDTAWPMQKKPRSYYW